MFELSKVNYHLPEEKKGRLLKKLRKKCRLLEKLFVTVGSYSQKSWFCSI